MIIYNKMQTLITFGKYKGYTYDYIYQNDKSYINWMISQSSNSNNIAQFQNFFKNYKLYDVNELKYNFSINCSELTNYMSNDNNVLNIINNININNINTYKIKINESISPQVYGQFIDYLIRYEISRITNKTFCDRRTSSIRLDIQHTELQNIVCEYRHENLDEIEEFNNEFINELSVESKIDVTKVKIMVDKYIKDKDKIKYIKKSYDELQNNNGSIIDILNICVSHSLAFGHIDDIKYVNFSNEIISQESHDNIIHYVKEKIRNKTNILLNPTLGQAKISADADLIIDNEIIDIKTSKYIDGDKNDFIQLIIYAALYYLKTSIICDKLSIYNPILGKEYSIKIDINLINNFLNIIKNYNIGSEIPLVI